MSYFDFTDTIHGVTIVPARDRLSTASLSPVEIDRQVQTLKDDLDHVAKAMKAAIAAPRPLGLRTTNDA